MRSAIAGAVLCVTHAAAASAQQDARVAEGRVMRPSATDQAAPVPVGDQWVVLHRVGSDRAGPLDSVRTGREGRFRFRYRATGSPDALYFVSATYGGIAYFSPPLRAPVVRGGDADVMVYDTSTDTSRLVTQGRHIVVSLGRGPRREVAEIFEIENQSPRTVVAGDSTPVWAIAIPEAAESASVAPGDVSAAAVRFTKGRAALFAPLSPGVRQFVITYLLPNDAFPVAYPMQRPTSVLEILLEDPRGGVSGVQLREMDAATIEGRTFRRLLGQDVPASAVAVIDMPSPPGQSARVVAIAAGVVGGMMLLALVVWWSRRRPAGAARVPSPMPPMSPADSLIAQLAQLDARHERAGARDAAADADYQHQRAELKARIERALAAERQQP